MRQANEYTAVIRRKSEDGQAYYEATLKEFGEGVVIDSADPLDAIKSLYETGEFVIADMTESGDVLPEPEQPQPWTGFSGKITLRMPRSLHYKLWSLANEEGVSLNSLVVKILAEGAEHRHCLLRPMAPTSRQLNVVFQNVMAQPTTMDIAERPPSLLRSQLQLTS